ncbi:agmatine hydroxycinnamoyltransferase 1-like [Musa acuminata AAA Group]|uniref:agmatine hydroxycinnamoyltransferase 1-like n=1 Tax=Musa acuminata AAA Group TaxID=214697 RepID=UPI0031DEA3DD
MLEDGKSMKVRVERSKIVKPLHKGEPTSTCLRVPLSVFDKITYDTHMAVIYAFRPPTPSNTDIEKGLATVLSEYREWAGRLGEDARGEPVVLLNDAGAQVFQASSDAPLDVAGLLKPSPALLTLHPGIQGVEELVQVQLTRFACGSLVVGFTAHHLVADGHAASKFLVAWGAATRGLPIHPIPFRGRSALFVPREPPRVEFQHRGAEFTTKKMFNAKDDPLKDDIVVHKAHFTKPFLTALKAKASLGSKRQYSTFESLVAHLWRVISKARGLDERTTSDVRISVDGRRRLSPPVPDEYLGNLVLWAFPRAQVGELINSPLQHAAALIHEGIERVDDRYFRSFIDFAKSAAVELEGLVTTADMNEWVVSPNLEVHSWLRFPFYDVNFGGGTPFCFMPTYSPVEGMLVLLPSTVGDGSIEVYVPLFNHNLATFKHLCCLLD